ncbi:MAG: hypothetical protein ACLQNU_05845 [Candidatus Dormibacteria bacterium]
MVVGAICWALCLLFFIDQGIAEAASKAPYSPITNLISDLGVTRCGPLALGSYHNSICSPLHALIDWTFVVVGVLQALGAILLFPAWPRQSREWINGMIGLALIPMAGACLTIVGLAPENVSPDAHATAAKIGIYLLNAAVLQIGISLVRVSRVAGVLSLVAAITGWVGTGLLFGAATAVPLGLSERLADFPGSGVLVALGVFVLARALHARLRTS